MCFRHNVLKSKIASVKFPCGVCMKGVGVNSILCLRCRNCVQKWCSGIKTSLRNCEDFIFKTCSTTTRAVDPFLACIAIDRDEFEIVSEFYYLSNVTGHNDCLYWISLEDFSRTSTNTHKQRYISCKPLENI